MRIFAFAAFTVAVFYGLHLLLSRFLRLSKMGARKIAKGTECTWWDAAHKVSFIRQGKAPLACCPYCSGPAKAFDEDKWWREVEAHETPNYRKFVERSRGMCFHSTAELADHLAVGWSPLTMMRD